MHTTCIHYTFQTGAIYSALMQTMPSSFLSVVPLESTHVAYNTQFDMHFNSECWSSERCIAFDRNLDGSKSLVGRFSLMSGVGPALTLLSGADFRWHAPTPQIRPRVRRPADRSAIRSVVECFAAT